MIRVAATDRAGNGPAKCFEVDIAREPRAGRLGYFATTDLDLSDRMRLSVNQANGNLPAQNTYPQLPGLGLDVVLGRSYNSWNTGRPNELGPGWQFSLGQRRLDRSPAGTWICAVRPATWSGTRRTLAV